MSSFLSFLVACVIIELTPGPNMAYLTALSSVHGKKAGFSMVAGIAAGLLAIGLVAAFGATAIILESPALYHSLRWAGIAYMVWLAWDNWQTPLLSEVLDSHFDIRYFRRGFITNVLNPKAMVFYVSVFPGFIDPSQPVMAQSITLTLVYVSIATGIHALIAILGDKMHPLLGNPQRLQLTRRSFSVLMLSIALWFAWSTAV